MVSARVTAAAPNDEQVPAVCLAVARSFNLASKVSVESVVQGRDAAAGGARRRVV